MPPNTKTPIQYNQPKPPNLPAATIHAALSKCNSSETRNAFALPNQAGMEYKLIAAGQTLRPARHK